jgi:hypothetical protein
VFKIRGIEPYNQQLNKEGEMQEKDFIAGANNIRLLVGFKNDEPVPDEKPKYQMLERVKCRGWSGSADFGVIIGIKPIYHIRARRWTWGYKIKWENNGPGLTFEFVPQGYLEKERGGRI